MTERLRQFQFQTLIYRVPAILASLSGRAAVDAYHELRRGWFGRFQFRYANHLPPRLRELLDDETEEQFALHEMESLSQPNQHNVGLDLIFSAYRELRIEHQIQYANDKLDRDKNSLLSSAVRQHEVLRGVSLACILMVFCIELLLAFSMVVSWGGFVRSAWLHVGVLWFAIAVLAARALEEGLQPGREIERYARYRAAMRRLELLFDQTDDVDEKRKRSVKTPVQAAASSRAAGFQFQGSSSPILRAG